MNEPSTIEGKWWIDGSSNVAHFGILHYAPSVGLELAVRIPQEKKIEELFKTFSEPPPEVPSTIFGRDKDNNPISLYGCCLTDYNSSGGLKSYTILSQIALIGWEISVWDEVSFHRINAEYSLLHNWMNVRNITFGKNKTLKIKDKNSKAIEVEINSTATIVIWPTLQLNQNISGIDLIEGHGIEFRFTEALSVKESCFKYIDSFRRFLTLLIGRPVFVDKIYFNPNNAKDPANARLLRSNPGVETADRKVLFPQMLVSYPDIRDVFDSVVRKWFEMGDTFSDVLNLYFATVFAPNLYMHQTFLFLAQALEVYHRTSPKFKNQVQSKTAFRSRKQSIIRKVPEEEEWLTEKLAHANEKTLAQRLNELMELHRLYADQFIEDKHVFTNSIRHTRNHYTHYGTEEKKMNKVAKGVELLALTHKMKSLLEICIFSDLGISGAPIDRIIQNYKNHQYFSL